MNVRVGLTTGGAIQIVPCGLGATVADVFRAVDVPIALGDQLLHNGKSVPPDYQVKDEALILLSKPIEGG